MTGAPTSPVEAAIERHRQAYALWIAALDRIWKLHEAFDVDMEIQDPADIRAALTTIHGQFAAEEIAQYESADAAANAAAPAEDEAWTVFSVMVPATPADVLLWSDYLIEHAAQGDEAVTLQRAVKHLAALLAERLAA